MQPEQHSPDKFCPTRGESRFSLHRLHPYIRIPTIRTARRLNGIAKVIEQHGSWAVTKYGVEHLGITPDGQPMPRYLTPAQIHIPGITKIVFTDPLTYDPVDFCLALDAARKRWPCRQRFTPRYGRGSRPRPARPGSETQRRITPGKRFEILKRDDYRCQLCGRTAAGHLVVLHVDHRHPVSKGGTDDDANLWTLCSDCNLGKSDRPL